MCEGEGWRARFAASGQRDAENHKIMKWGGTEPARGEGGEAPRWCHEIRLQVRLGSLMYMGPGRQKAGTTVRTHSNE